MSAPTLVAAWKTVIHNSSVTDSVKEHNRRVKSIYPLAPVFTTLNILICGTAYWLLLLNEYFRFSLKKKKEKELVMNSLWDC